MKQSIDNSMQSCPIVCYIKKLFVKKRALKEVTADSEEKNESCQK